MQHSYNIYFLAKSIGKNYLQDPDAYSRLCNGSFNHIVYYYWILKNNLTDKRYNFFLVEKLPKSINKKDIVIFYYDTSEGVNFTDCISVQSIGDKPIVDKSAYFITHNTCMVNENTFFIHLPLPYNIKKQSPVFPPKNFTGVGALHSFHKEITTNKFKEHCKGLDINFDIITDKNYPYNNLDVFIFLRDINLPTYKNIDGTPLHPASVWSPFYGNTHRHANRLYQAWYMNTPLIHNKESAITNIVKSKYDILYAETPKELIMQMLFLKKNKEIYYKMINNCKNRENENSHSVIINQFLEMFKKICQ